MTALKKKKNDKVDFRVSADDKLKIKAAADFTGENLSDFILSRIMPDVERLIASEAKIRLNNAAWSGFAEMLSSPKKASDSLKAAMKKFRKEQEV